MVAYRDQIQSYTLTEIKQLYTDTFDFNKQAPLYMTYNKFDTQKERGQMLAKLKVLYEMFGLEMVDNELSDYLPLMLEFLYAAQWQMMIVQKAISNSSLWLLKMVLMRCSNNLER